MTRSMAGWGVAACAVLGVLAATGCGSTGSDRPERVIPDFVREGPVLRRVAVAVFAEPPAAPARASVSAEGDSGRVDRFDGAGKTLRDGVVAIVVGRDPRPSNYVQSRAWADFPCPFRPARNPDAPPTPWSGTTADDVLGVPPDPDSVKKVAAAAGADAVLCGVIDSLVADLGARQTEGGSVSRLTPSGTGHLSLRVRFVLIQTPAGTVLRSQEVAVDGVLRFEHEESLLDRTRYAHACADRALHVAAWEFLHTLIPHEVVPLPDRGRPTGPIAPIQRDPMD